MSDDRLVRELADAAAKVVIQTRDSVISPQELFDNLEAAVEALYPGVIAQMSDPGPTA